MKRRWWAVAACAVVALGSGGWYAYHRLEEAAAEHVAVTVLSDPTVKREVAAVMRQAYGRSAGELEHALATESNTSLTSKGALRTPPGPTSPSAPSQGAAPSQGVGSSAGRTGGSGAASGGGASPAAPLTSVASTPASAESQPIVFHSKQQAIDFILSRFTRAEILEYARLYAERSKLTPAEKARIKAQILSRFTPQQIAALEAVLG
ncbi:hypothetical protein [Alicyclobacillus fructus]|uniref:hypothetical protein n=1 Tax=Alicyclobacillus fructus TaxID=2816082 RepID=UPI001A8EA305|nr:hypothetical protein [Alicyclobacillus fructus]